MLKQIGTSKAKADLQEEKAVKDDAYIDQIVEFVTSDKEWVDHESNYDEINVSTKYDMNDQTNVVKKTLTSKHSKDIKGDEQYLKRKRIDNI